MILEIWRLDWNTRKNWNTNGPLEIELKLVYHTSNMVKSKPKHQSESHIRKYLRISTFRSMRTSREKVVALHNDHGVSISVISCVLELPKASVHIWISKTRTREGRGRPSYLSPAGLKQLFEDVVAEQADHHKPLSLSQILVKIRWFLQVDCACTH